MHLANDVESYRKVQYIDPHEHAWSRANAWRSVFGSQKNLWLLPIHSWFTLRFSFLIQQGRGRH
jgi:hypothetical protein